MSGRVGSCEPNCEPMRGPVDGFQCREPETLRPESMSPRLGADDKRVFDDACRPRSTRGESHGVRLRTGRSEETWSENCELYRPRDSATLEVTRGLIELHFVAISYDTIVSSKAPCDKLI